MKRILPLILVWMLLLSACQGEEQPIATTTVPSTTNTEVPPSSSVTPPSSDPTDETTQATDPADETDPTETQPQLDYQNPLNGEALADPFMGRPVAVMLNNIKAAMPQHGVSQADILFEVLAEGGITRCMGIYSNIADVEKLGSVRSARKYYVDIARGYGAAYVHAGGSEEALNYLTGLKKMDLDGLTTSAYFYRDQDRINANYSLEHTLFTSGEKLLAFAGQCGVPMTLEQEQSYEMAFDDGTLIVGEAAKKVTVYFNQGGKPSSYTKSTILTYDEDTKQYFAQQHGGNYIDGNTKETVSFRNIVVLYAPTRMQSDNYHLTVDTVGSGTGYFFCNGQKVAIHWSRESVNDPFRYTLENGKTVTFGVGSTYIGVIPTNATVTWE